MEDNRIGEIVRKVFEKARNASVSKAKSALSNAIADEITEKYKYIHPKTLERAYDRYVNGKIEVGKSNAESVNLFCNYLGFEDYKEYIKSNQVVRNNPKQDEKKNNEKNISNSSRDEATKHRKKWKWAIMASVAFGSVLIVILIMKTITSDQISLENRCMAWAKTHYEETACDTSPYSEYGTHVEPFDPVRFSNFKKVQVTMATTFFTEGTNQPLLWYCKTKKGEIEYFTAPGLHPITRKTLDEITPYIIEKYVPLHSNAKNSFVK